MEFREEKRDLFTVDDNEYYFVQCISADYAMAAGIAVDFNKKYNIKNIMMTQPENVLSSWDKSCLLVNNKVFNLVTKTAHYQKPTYKSLRKSLMSMKVMLLNNPEIINKSKLAMPRIGCGLDRLEWNKVSEIIQDVFKDTNVEILVCSL